MMDRDRWQTWSMLVVLLTMALMVAACGAPANTGMNATPLGTARTSSPGQAAATAPARPSVTARRSPSRQVATTATADTAALVLTIAPASGPAGTVFEITGTGLPPNATLHTVGRGQDLSIIMSLPATVGADGHLILRYNSLGQAPGPYTVVIGSDLAAAMEPGGRASLPEASSRSTREGRSQL